MASSGPQTSTPVAPSDRFLDALGFLQRKPLVSGAAHIRSSLKADKRGRSQVFDSILEGASKPRYVQPVLTFCLPTNGSFAWDREVLDRCGNIEKSPG